ncbi:hypothetical protein [Radicibacter daui]|uniref:hypothetical protein n=1 Tax=Radicibacter daui TaxID=3064829 RepID=UPI004046D309
MTPREWLRVLLKNPGILPGVAFRITHQIAARFGRQNDLAGFAAQGEGNLEQKLYQSRANWLVETLLDEGADGAIARFLELAAGQLAEDPYSLSQRLCHLVYLKRLLPSGSELPTPLQRLAHTAAAGLAQKPEYRRATTWFNNHLLNNFRAGELYTGEFGNHPDAVDLTQFRQRVEGILTRHLDTLFLNGTGPRLNEGSVSYEILILRHLVDLACCPARTALSDRFREWVVSGAREMVMMYRKDNQWLLPRIGDVTPDWTSRSEQDFLDGLVLGRHTVYRQIWSVELDRLGFTRSGTMNANEGSALEEGP